MLYYKPVVSTVSVFFPTTGGILSYRDFGDSVRGDFVLDSVYP